jgi:hypothetical protein
MKNPTAEALAQAVELKRAGQKWPAILATTGLNHTQAELAWIEANITSEQRAMVNPEATLATNVEALRNSGASWGTIMAILGENEGTVRRAWTEATNLKSKGLRNGHGGRFYMGLPELYEGGLEPTGTEIPKDAVGRDDARRFATIQRIAKLSRDELKVLAADYGIDPKGLTPARVAQKITQAMGVTDEPKAKGSSPKRAKRAPKAEAAA